MKKRLLMLFGLLPLLFTTACGGPIGEQIVKDGVKKFLEAADPSWRSSWFVVDKVPELDGLMGLLLGFAVVVGAAVAFASFIKVLQGFGFFEGITGIGVLVASATVPLGLYIISVLGSVFFPADMSFSNLAEKMRWIQLPDNMVVVNTIISSVVFSVIIPHLNAGLQLLSALWFAMTLLGAIPSKDYRGLMLAGSWLVGPIIFPWIFWWIVGYISQSHPITGNAGYDDLQVIVMNGKYLGAVTIAFLTTGILIYLTVRTTIAVGNFSGVTNIGESTSNRRHSSLSELATAFGAGAVVAEAADGEEEQKSKSSKRKKSVKGDSEHDESGTAPGEYPYGRYGPRALFDDPDGVVEGEVREVDGGGPDENDGSDGATFGINPTSISGDHDLRPVDENETTIHEDDSESELHINNGGWTETDDEVTYQSSAPSVTLQHGLEPVEESVISSGSTSSGEMKNLIERYGGFENIPWRSLSLREDHADDVRHNIEAAHHESSANFMKHHQEEWGNVWSQSRNTPDKVVTVKGHHYRIVDEQRAPHVGATKRTVKFNDGRSAGTFLLEYIGEIPSRWRHWFPNNAEFEGA